MTEVKKEDLELAGLGTKVTDEGAETFQGA